MWTLHDRPRIAVSPGFLLLMGVLFWLDEGVGLLPWGLLACVLHELGHIAVATALGGHVKELSLTVIGAELSINYDMPLNYEQESMVALAGPMSNLLSGGLFTALGLELAVMITLAVGAFNLLPVLPLDGGHVLYGLLADRLDSDWADRLMTALSGCLVGALVGLGMVAAMYYANVTLLLTALWLLAGILRWGRE